MNNDNENGKSDEFLINNQYNEQLPMFIKQKETSGNQGKKEKKKGKRHRR